MDDELIEQLTPQHVKAIVAIMAHPTIEKAANAAGVPVRTLYNWLEMPVFRKALRSARRKGFDQALGMIFQYTPVAVNVMGKIMLNPDEPAGARVAAASTIVKLGREAVEIDDLAGRVEEIEEAIKSAQPKKNGWS